MKERICQLKGWEVPQLKLIYSGELIRLSYQSNRWRYRLYFARDGN